MGLLAFTAVSALIASYFCIHILRPFAFRVGLLDVPTHRKRHSGAIPLIGGLALYGAVAITGLMIPEVSQRVKLWLTCAGILVVIGALDDKFDVPASARLAIQILVSIAMVIGTGLSLNDFGNLFGFGNVELGFLAVPITVLAIVTAINAFNMVDGIDGLLGVHTLIAVGSTFLLMLLSGGHVFLPLTLALVAAIIPYLIFNLGYNSQSGKKIFMGDAGSMFIGFAVVWLLIEATHSQVSSFRPITAIWIIALPLMDLTSTFMRRIRKGKSPFTPDRTHLHHLFQRMGFNSRQTLLLIGLIAFILASIGVFGELLRLPEVLMFFLFVVFYALYEYFFGRHAWVLVRRVRRVVGVKSKG